MINQNHSGEMLYRVENVDGRYIITGFVDRDAAHKTGVQHLTTIIVPFVVGSGKWLVHDRTAKLWAKGNIHPKTPSYNLFGGHCTANSETNKTNIEVQQELLDNTAIIELSQELLCSRGTEQQLEVWEDGEKTDEPISASQYPIGELIKIGYATYKDGNNVEASFVYALPIPAEDVDKLIAADNYMRDDDEHDVWLPISVMDETELKILANSARVKIYAAIDSLLAMIRELMENKSIKYDDVFNKAYHAEEGRDIKEMRDLLCQYPGLEVCDAITRLWLPENEAILKKLRTVIADYQGDCYGR